MLNLSHLQGWRKWAFVIAVVGVVLLVVNLGLWGWMQWSYLDYSGLLAECQRTCTPPKTCQMNDQTDRMECQ
jgi:hypothetical protein